MNKPQTAVEWLAERLPYLVMDRGMLLITEEEYNHKKQQLVNEAMKLERSQLEKAHVDGTLQTVRAANKHEFRTCTDYYRDIYGDKITE